MKTEQQIRLRMGELLNTFIEQSLNDYASNHKEITLKSLKEKIKELRWVLNDIKN